MHAETDRLISDLARCPAASISALVATYIKEKKLSRVVGSLNLDLLEGSEPERAKAVRVLEKIGFPT